MYDSSTGRWFNEDPDRLETGDTNRYRYVGNNATNATDLSGTHSERRIGITYGPIPPPPPIQIVYGPLPPQIEIEYGPLQQPGVAPGDLHPAPPPGGLPPGDIHPPPTPDSLPSAVWDVAGGVILANLPAHGPQDE